MTDNFIIQTSDLIVRMDVGVSEGDNVLRVVAAIPNMGVFYDSDGKAFGGLCKISSVLAIGINHIVFVQGRYN